MDSQLVPQTSFVSFVSSLIKHTTTHILPTIIESLEKEPINIKTLISIPFARIEIIADVRLSIRVRK
jgi:hypothetical protein